MEKKKFKSSLFSGSESWWTQIPLMLNWGIFPSFTLTLTVLCAASWKGTYGHFCSCYSTEQSQSNSFTCKFSKMSLPGTLPHGVDGRHQGGSCPAAFISPLALLVPSYDPERPRWDELQGQMTPVTPRTKQTGSVHRQTWGFRLLLGLPEKIIRKTYPVQWNSWSRSNPQISQLL